MFTRNSINRVLVLQSTCESSEDVWVCIKCHFSLEYWYCNTKFADTHESYMAEHFEIIGTMQYVKASEITFSEKQMPNMPIYLELFNHEIDYYLICKSQIMKICICFPLEKYQIEIWFHWIFESAIGNRFEIQSCLANA